ncbi:MAG: isoprenylcysteine carboxylmethyltransferase family protein [Acetobacteraceae bacterium]|jgi:protein-S-isoprenylcysteine O-methyltransferase Ste14
MMTEDRIPRSAMPSIAVMLVVCAAVLFGTAGRMDVIEFWCWLVELAAICVATVLIIEPDLVRERMRPAGKSPSPGYWLSTLLFLVILAIAGLDRGRLHWSDGVPVWLRATALLLFALGWVPVIWAMRVNRFFSSAVRIQPDRGQRVISGGPYRFVRHPGYTAALVVILANGIALGSWLAAAIGWVGVPILLWRTIKEDRMLSAELPGYADYAARVPWRLLPGIW